MHSKQYVDKFPYDTFTVGFDKILDRLQMASDFNNSPYPPYNIVKVGEEQYEIEIAVAGFRESELSVSVKEGVVTVEGKAEEGETAEYLHKGIAKRAFTRKFTLADTVEVEGADLSDGLLSIKLRNVVPESKKPRLIAINSDKQLLTE